jgi:hypothetical protein
MVKVHCDEGLTNHIGPESFVAVREGVREALTGVRAGQAIERRNFAFREAHAFLTAEGNMATIRFVRIVPSRGVKDPGMYGSLSRGSREISTSAQERRAQGRIGKA